MVGVAEGKLAGNQQHAISGDGERRSRFHRYDVSHLRLSHAEERLLIAEVHFNVPALEVRLDDLAGVQSGVGANEKGGVSVEKLRAFAQAVGKWRDDDQLQNLLDSGRAPHHVLPPFEAQRMRYAGMSESHALPGFRIVGAELLGSRGERAIT